jgi:hypothetical protein
MDPNTLVLHSIVQGYTIATILFPHECGGKTMNLFETTIWATERETNGKLLNEIRKITASKSQAYFNHLELKHLAVTSWNIPKK